MIVELNHLKFYAYHGLYDFEREKGGEYIVDVLIDSADETNYLQLNDVVNYEDIYRIVNQHMQTPKDFIEEVARLILNDLKVTFSNAKVIEVKITKCAPPIPSMKGSARVTANYKK
jgi:dihydroneopterin aldolase